MAATIRLIVQGKVQGVFYRATVKKWADELGVTGHACNLDDGSVEVVAQGAADALAELESRCYDGVRAAEVDTVERFDVDKHPPAKDFVIT